MLMASTPNLRGASRWAQGNGELDMNQLLKAHVPPAGPACRGRGP